MMDREAQAAKCSTERIYRLQGDLLSLRRYRMPARGSRRVEVGKTPGHHPLTALQRGDFFQNLCQRHGLHGGLPEQGELPSGNHGIGGSKPQAAG